MVIVWDSSERSVKMSANHSERRRGPQIEEQELASRTIQIQNKRFYLDVKQNPRGRFIKLTEVGVGGQKSRILMSVPAANELKEKIEKLSAAYEKLSPHNPKSLATDGLIESETIVRDNRRYYLDLRENERGRFLRISMLSMGARVHIALPADGLIELRDALADLIQNHCRAEDFAATQDLPEAKVLFAGNKTFYFDVGSNRYGVFLRISELRANYRTAVTIPEHHWTRFRDILSDLASKIDIAKSSPKTTGDSNGSREELENDVEEEHEKEADVSSSEVEKEPETSIKTAAASATDSPKPKAITVS
ncbi:unnamed protein product [Schistocephalus solidus]|uniref:Transcriptional activator protein Pur-alpha n=2 Tax=Schistocephalus solidus TaxID=70667 RepID=A0A3P7F0C4_SCHSO|nr:unnamed protein product [Schistocephalus solidus]